jgi:GLPGLI family protein
MKNLFFTTVMLLLLNNTYAQEFYGTITYESKRAIPELSGESLKNIPPDMVDMVKQMSETAGQATFTMSFTKNASIYEQVKKPMDVSEDMVIMVSTEEEDSKYYMDFKKNKIVQEVDFLDKTFIITDSLSKRSWKLEAETKKIGDYTCRKATCIIKAGEMDTDVLKTKSKEDMLVTVWYTPEIAIPFGPEGYWGLPGLILELNDAQRTILCSKIALNPAQKPEIKEPVKGKKVSRAEFYKIMFKRLEEMKARRPKNAAEHNGVFIELSDD